MKILNNIRILRITKNNRYPNGNIKQYLNKSHYLNWLAISL